VIILLLLLLLLLLSGGGAKAVPDAGRGGESDATNRAVEQTE
jgi:hypothetical protein